MPNAFLVRVGSRGLHHDANLLSEYLEKEGYKIYHIIHPLQWKYVSVSWTGTVNPLPVKGDIVIMIENICLLRDLLKTEARLVLLPNLELLSTEHVQMTNILFDDVWHKCRFSAGVYNSLSLVDVPKLRHTHLGFVSKDLYRAVYPKQWKKRFIHIFGTSPSKNSNDLYRLWLKHPEWPTLLMVGTSMGPINPTVPNVIHHDHLDDAEHLEAMNSHGIHLCPSAAEGWGHYIVEAMSCKSVVVTTEAPPMSDHIKHGETGFIVPLRITYPYREYARAVINDDRGNNAARWCSFSFEGMERVIQQILEMPESKLLQMGENARAWFIENEKGFRERLHTVLKEPRIHDLESKPTSAA